MKKRILAVVLTAAAMLTMGACGQGRPQAIRPMLLKMGKEARTAT